MVFLFIDFLCFNDKIYWKRRKFVSWNRILYDVLITRIAFKNVRGKFFSSCPIRFKHRPNRLKSYIFYTAKIVNVPTVLWSGKLYNDLIWYDLLSCFIACKHKYTVGNNIVDFRKDLEIIKQYTVLNQKNIKRGNLSLTLLMIRIILCIC